MDEKRRYMRFDTSLDLECVSPVAAAVTSKNISREGLCFSTDKAFSVGSLLDIKLNVPGDNVPVFAQAEVAWSREFSQGVGNFDTGARFIKITGLDRSRLLEFVYSQWLKAKGITKSS